jgi:hypothetical protein
MEHKIEYLPGGDVTVDGQRLAGGTVGVLVRGLVDSQRLDDYLTTEGGPADVEACCARLLSCRKAGDKAGAQDAFEALCEAQMVEARMSPEAQAPEGKVPTTKQLATALRAGAGVVSGWPLESHNGRRDPAQLRDQAGTLEGQDGLLSIFVRCAKVARWNVGHTAQESVAWVEKLIGAIAEAEPGNPRLQAAAAPMHAYFTEPFEKGLDTKRTTARVWDEAATQTEAAVVESARSEARAELKEKLGTRFSDLIDE